MHMLGLLEPAARLPAADGPSGGSALGSSWCWRHCLLALEVLPLPNATEPREEPTWYKTPAPPGKFGSPYKSRFSAFMEQMKDEVRMLCGTCWLLPSSVLLAAASGDTARQCRHSGTRPWLEHGWSCSALHGGEPAHQPPVAP